MSQTAFGTIRMCRLMFGSGRLHSAHSCICLRSGIALLTATTIEALAIITAPRNRRPRHLLRRRRGVHPEARIIRHRAAAAQRAAPAALLHLKYPLLLYPTHRLVARCRRLVDQKLIEFG